MQPDDIESIIITPEEEGERLDKILAARFQGLQSRTYFQYLIEEEKVLVNGIPVKKRVQPKAGDEVEIEYILTPEIGLEPEPIPLWILFEDPHILVINKPAGMVVHPAPGNWTGTFVNALLHHCKNLIVPNTPATDARPGIVHRLDKDTSGVLIAAKTAQAHQKLVQMFAAREIHKEYQAICLGNPGDAEINAPIGRHPVHRKMMTVLSEGGRDALTYCTTLAHKGDLSLVNIVLATGRTHQIRVHMKHIGHPILGDATYGSLPANKKYGAERQMLHAKLLRMKHPITGQAIEFQATIPDDMAKFITKIRSP